MGVACGRYPFAAVVSAGRWLWRRGDRRISILVARERRVAARRWDWSVCSVFCLALFGLHDLYANDVVAEARTWLDKVVKAAQSNSYQGTFIYRRGDQVMAMDVIHVADKEGERERLVSLSGDKRVLVRSKEGVVCLLPGHKRRTVSTGGFGKPIAGGPFSKIDAFDDYYHFSVRGGQRVAGRDARLILIEPRDRYRYGYRIWADEQTGLLLQSDLVDENGEAIEQMMFTRMNVVDKPTSAMLEAVTLDEDSRALLRESQPGPRPVNDLPWRLSGLPAGFSLAESYRHSDRSGRAGLEQMVLSDGVASVSVFLEPLAADDEPFVGLSHMGAVHAFGAVLRNYQLTVVGEVPAETVRLIGRAVKPVEGAQ